MRSTPPAGEVANSDRSANGLKQTAWVIAIIVIEYDSTLLTVEDACCGITLYEYQIDALETSHRPEFLGATGESARRASSQSGVTQGS